MKRWLSIAVLVTLLSSVCFAEGSTPVKKKAVRAKDGQKTEQPVTTKQEPKKVLMRFSMGMVEGNSIDLHYAGSPIEQVIGAIENIIKLTKGEFESTAAFNSRKEAAISSKFLNDLTIQDTFAFVVPVSNGARSLFGLRYEFDADTSEVRFFALVSNSKLNGIGGPNFTPRSFDSPAMDQIDLYHRVGNGKTYQASNAYGATITVTKVVSSDFGIAVPTIPFLTYKRYYFYSKPTPSAQITMENTKAQKELPALKAIIVMKLADPYVLYHFNHDKPTRDSPTEITNSKKFLTGEVLGIIFYSGLTGEIFARIPDNFGKAVAKPEPQSLEKASTLGT